MLNLKVVSFPRFSRVSQVLTTKKENAANQFAFKEGYLKGKVFKRFVVDFLISIILFYINIQQKMPDQRLPLSRKPFLQLPMTLQLQTLR